MWSTKTQNIEKGIQGHMNILITGAAGALGRNLVENLKAIREMQIQYITMKGMDAQLKIPNLMGNLNVN